MDGRTNERTENLPILQDFVPYWGRCPASPHENKEKEEQGKGTADHLMPLGYLFSFISVLINKGANFNPSILPIFVDLPGAETFSKGLCMG